MAYVKTSLVRFRRIRWLGGFQFGLGASHGHGWFPSGGRASWRERRQRGQEVRGKDKPESRVRRSALDTTMNEGRQEEIETIDKRERSVRGSIADGTLAARVARFRGIDGSRGDKERGT